MFHLEKIRFARRAERKYNRHFTCFLLRKSDVDHYEILISNVNALTGVLGKCILVGSLIEN